MRFLSRHYVLGAMLILAPQLVIPLILIVVCSIRPVAYHDVRLVAVLLLSGVCPFAAGFILTYVRRRASLRIKPVMSVILAAPIQLAAQWTALVYVMDLLPYHQYYGNAIPYTVSNWQVWFMLLPAASVGLPLPLGFAGLGLGLLLTRRRGNLTEGGDKIVEARQ